MDPAVVLYMMQKGRLSAHEADVLMNKKSGFLGMCGHADVRAVLQAADDGDDRAKTALEVCNSYSSEQLRLKWGVKSRPCCRAISGQKRAMESASDLDCATCMPKSNPLRRCML
jgi:hypothetical protein